MTGIIKYRHIIIRGLSSKLVYGLAHLLQAGVYFGDHIKTQTFEFC